MRARIVLPDAACCVNKRFIKPAIVRLIRIGITQMPLAKNTSGIARGL